MHKTRTFLLASLALFLAGAAQADVVAGSYKFAVGSSAACTITLADNGTVSFVGDCSTAGGVARWQAKYNGVELKTASGETVGILKAKDDSYAGTRFSDGRALVLTH